MTKFKYQTLIFDTEGDGLLDTVTTLHCLHIQEYETGKTWTFRKNDKENTVEIGVRMLEKAERVVAHNGIGYDYVVLSWLFDFNPKGELLDTLVYSRIIYGHRKELDFDLYAMDKIPGNMIGRHGLESWGHRLGLHKGDYAEMMREKGLDPWASWNPEQEEYCVNDVDITVLLWEKIQKENYPIDPIILEHEMSEIMILQEHNGFPFDIVEAKKLESKLVKLKDKLHDKLVKDIKPWYVVDGKTIVPKKTINYKDPKRISRIAGEAFTKIKLQKFNPNSRPQIANRLQVLYGWEPTKYTDKGNVAFDEEVVQTIIEELPVANDISTYLMLNKRLSQLATGDKAWLKFVQEDGKIYGHINPCGTVTGRPTHSNPNMSQVPSLEFKELKNGTKKPLYELKGRFGYECRALFHVPESTGFVLVGADLSGVELRCLAHYIHEYDKGAYADVILEGKGQIHKHNQKMFDVDDYKLSKKLIYTMLYGAGDEKLGKTVIPEADLVAKKKRGRELKNNFFHNIPGIRKLIRRLEREWNRYGYIIGLDGRRLYIRKKHAILNTLLQNAGAVIAKLWITGFERDMIDQGYDQGWDGDYAYLSWSHDEFQIAVRKDLAEKVSSILKQKAKEAGILANFNMPTAADCVIGKNWAETH